MRVSGPDIPKPSTGAPMDSRRRAPPSESGGRHPVPPAAIPAPAVLHRANVLENPIAEKIEGPALHAVVPTDGRGLCAFWGGLPSQDLLRGSIRRAGLRTRNNAVSRSSGRSASLAAPRSQPERAEGDAPVASRAPTGTLAVTAGHPRTHAMAAARAGGGRQESPIVRWSTRA